MSSDHDLGSDPTTTDRRTFIGIAGGTVVGLAGLSSVSEALGKTAPVGRAPRPPRAATGVLRVGFPDFAGGVDPAVNGATGGAGLSRQVFEGLLGRNVNGLPIPALATSYESSRDAREWVFQLRKGVKFHDGAEFDSTAVKRSIEHYRDVASPWIRAIPATAELDDSDPEVFRVKSKDPAPDVARACPVIQMLSPKTIRRGNRPVTKFVGTGPFRFVSYQANQKLVLEANRVYWGSGPYFKRLEFVLINDPAARLAALRSGTVDFLFKVGPEQLPQLRSSRFRIVTSDTWTGTYLVFFGRSALGSNRLVRQAVAHAIDRNALIRAIALNHAAPMNSWMPRGTYGAVAVKTTYDYDPRKARTLLAQSGVNPSELSFTIASNEFLSARNALLAQAISQMLSDVGIKTNVYTIQSADWAKLSNDPAPWEALPGDLGWLDGGPTFVTVPYLQGWPGYKSAEYQRLAGKVNRLADGRHRKNALAVLQEKVAKEVPIIPLFHPKISSAMKSDVYGFSNPRDAFLPDFRTVYRGNR